MEHKQNIGEVQTAEDILEKFIAFEIINAMLSRNNLFHALHYSNANTPKIQAFQNFVTMFSSLYIATKHNIKRSGKIIEWDKKERKYEEFFKNNISENSKNMSYALQLFDEFVEDLARSGIYSLIEEVGIGDEGFGDEVEG